MIQKFSRTVLQSHRIDDRERLTPQARAFQKVLHRTYKRLPGPVPPRYNVTASHSHKLLWFRVAKVGTRTTLRTLRESEITLNLDHASNLYIPNWLAPGYVRAAFVRHPIERFISAWQNRVVRTNSYDFDDETLEKMQDISNFIDWFAQKNPDTCDRHLRRQAVLIPPTKTLDLLGRMETFDNDLDRMLELIGIGRETSHHLNVSKREPPKLKSADHKRLAEIFAPDFERFGYKP